MSAAVESVGAPGSTHPLPVEPDHRGAQAGPLGPSTFAPGDVYDFPPHPHPDGPYGGCRALLVDLADDGMHEWVVLADDNGHAGYPASLRIEDDCQFVRHETPAVLLAARAIVAADNARIAAQTAQAVA